MIRITTNDHKYYIVECDTDVEIAQVCRICRPVSRGPKMSVRCNRTEARALAALATPATTHQSPTPAREWQNRLVITVTEFGRREEAPATIERGGSTYRFSGYGKTFRPSGEMLRSGMVDPDARAICYAYYV